MAKYKRTNLGQKEGVIETQKKPKNRIYYPSFYVRKKLPLDETAIGKMFEVKAKVKLVGIDQNVSEDKNDFNYNFNVIDIGF